MEETVSIGSLESPAVENHAYSDEDVRNVLHTDSSRVHSVLCKDKTLTETVTSEEMMQADCTGGTELVDSAELQRSSTATAANIADEGVQTAAGETTNDHIHPDMQQASANGSVSMQQSGGEKSLDVSSTVADHELKRTANQTKQKFGTFHQLDHPASVVIDLRSPPLVQVCLLHGTDDDGAGGSGSSGSSRVYHRPQTARRGRQRHSTTACHRDHKDVFPSAPDVPSMPSTKLVADDSKSVNKEKISAAELSTIIHLKVVETPAEKATSGRVTDNAVTDSVLLLRESDHDQVSESSDDSTMKVRNVNRTYSRNPSIPAARKHPQLITIAKSNDSRGGKKDSDMLFEFGTKTSRHAQEFKSVPKKLKKMAKQPIRVGPAWYSRRLLNAPPPEIWQCARASKSMKTLKRPNYEAGVRYLPIVSKPPTVKQMLKVPVVEELDVDSVGREQLKLWRLSENDVTELQSQLQQEAQHRRSEHIMPLVMQMTDAQIEHAYEHVAESMKTYEIVEADSDDEDMEEGEASEDDIADDYDNGGHLESSGLNIYDELSTKESGETEYSRLRPKRHAVDYGPAAFTPILIMEGRRMFSRRRKSGRESQLKSADMADRVKVQRRSSGHKSHRRKRKKSRLNDQQDDPPAGKCTDEAEDTAGHFCF